MKLVQSQLLTPSYYHTFDIFLQNAIELQLMHSFELRKAQLLLKMTLYGP